MKNWIQRDSKCRKSEVNGSDAWLQRKSHLKSETLDLLRAGCGYPLGLLTRRSTFDSLQIFVARSSAESARLRGIFGGSATVALFSVLAPRCVCFESGPSSTETKDSGAASAG